MTSMTKIGALILQQANHRVLQHALHQALRENHRARRLRGRSLGRASMFLADLASDVVKLVALEHIQHIPTSEVSR